MTTEQPDNIWREWYPDHAAEIDQAVVNLLRAISSMCITGATAMMEADATEYCVGKLRDSIGAELEADLGIRMGSVTVEPLPIVSAVNLFGGRHDHAFATPFRGYLMCSNEYCAAMTTTDGQTLSQSQQDVLRSEILKDYE